MTDKNKKTFIFVSIIVIVLVLFSVATLIPKNTVSVPAAKTPADSSWSFKTNVDSTKQVDDTTAFFYYFIYLNR